MKTIVIIFSEKINSIIPPDDDSYRENHVFLSSSYSSIIEFQNYSKSPDFLLTSY